MKTNQVVIIGSICLGLLASAPSGNAQIRDGNNNLITGSYFDPVLGIRIGDVSLDSGQSGLTANGIIQTIPGGARLDRNAVFAAVGNFDSVVATSATITGGAANGVNIGDVRITQQTGPNGSELHVGGSIVMSSSTGGGPATFDTVSSDTGTLHLQGNNATVNGAGAITGTSLSDGTATLSGGKLSVIRAGQTITVIDTVSGNITTINAETGNINTVNAVTGNIQTVNANQVNVGGGNATIDAAGVITGTAVVTPRLTLGGTEVTGIQTANQAGKELAAFTASDSTLATSAYSKQAAQQALTEANSYTRGRYDKLTRGIAMTAALETPTIEPGKNNALKVSGAGYEGSAGLSIGYARRLAEGWSADVSAATSGDWKEAVVRAGVNWSF